MLTFKTANPPHFFEYSELKFWHEVSNNRLQDADWIFFQFCRYIEEIDFESGPR